MPRIIVCMYCIIDNGFIKEKNEFELGHEAEKKTIYTIECTSIKDKIDLKKKKKSKG